ncbi:aminotransferase class III-fold pyridoxal phosphate-dependent enzyme [Streptomyces sp. NPDC096198]|uniref:aminotransferase class III-fold pyridoxal phosphate-dependent enzyme n=1 Tax=Streptomyces sp. NPDC096198 TaxID=3366080 RepID=UPI0037F1A8C2
MTDHHDSNDALRLRKALTAIRGLQARVRELEESSSQPVAVVGMGCRLPSAPDPDAYWELLRTGRDAIGDIPADRWDVDALYDPDPGAEDRMYCRRGGFLDDVAGFDAGFFGISPREAKRLDPQQRLLLEVAWEALEDSGRDPRGLGGSRTGVFVGISEAEYLHQMQRSAAHSVEMHDVTGTALSVASGRLSYHLGLRGPSLALDTACSSALVAVHLAVRSLRAGECDMALAGGASLMLSPDAFVAFCKGSALAADGRCKTFDSRADGYARGEGAGIVVLKRLADALADGDPVHAVIRGTAVNQDGRTNGLTAPNGLAQQEVVRAALADAGIAPHEVGYVEAHGTGTQLGDPIEVEALGTVFADRGPAGPLLIGAAKTNIGHLEAAAGAAGLIKAVQVLRHGQVPPNLHFLEPSPHIPWAALPVEVPTALRDWPDGTRAAGVSSFGFSGTNAHVVLEAAPPTATTARTPATGTPADATPAPDRTRQLLPLSARTPEALRELAGRYAAFLGGPEAPPLADAAHTAGTARSVHPHRLAVSAADSGEAAGLLAAYAEGRRARVATGHATARPAVAFLFTGQGSQYAGMGRQLFDTHPGFRRTLETCDEILRGLDLLDVPLLDVLYPAPDGPGQGLIDRTSHAQPALFALEYALAELWRSWGVEPHVVLGHSTGEYAAACVAGFFGLEDGLGLVARRARLIEDTTSGGATAAVLAPAEEVLPVLASYAGQVGVAGLNGPRETLIAGTADAVAEVLAELKSRGLDGRPLRIPHAPHSPMIEPALAAYEQAAARVAYTAPRVRMISNVTGGPVDAVDAAYWCRHMREPVRFLDAMGALAREDCGAILEVGPQPVLQLLGRQSWTGPAVRWPSSLWEGRDDWKQLLQGVAELYTAGVDIDWSAFDAPYPRRRVPAPTYPFQRTPHWFARREEPTVPEQPSPRASAPAPATEAGRHERILADLRERVGAGLEMEVADMPPGTTLVDLGADSLLMVRIIQDITELYGITLTVGRLFDDLDTPEAIAAHLDTEVPAGHPLPGDAPAAAPLPAPAAVPAPAAPAALPVAGTPALATAVAADQSGVAQLLAAQLDVMQRQLEVLARHGGTLPTAPAGTAALPATAGTAALPAPRREATPAAGTGTAPRPAAAGAPPRELTPVQRAHLDELLDTYKKRTAGSLARAVDHRARRADTRMRSVRPETRSVSYPVIGERGHGARFRDIDGNEYIDIAMGVGVLLCGHDPEFVAGAVADRLEYGLQLGPISSLSDEVAELICELTGVERLFFAVTGTDAVRGALRMAQAATGRSRFVMFSGSYHGQDDRVLALPDVLGDPTHSVPMAPGVSPQSASDPLILTYGAASALKAIEEHADQLAGVLVEPVQSRNPALQPAGFLRELRELTTRLGIPLIFDEVITGFRVHPGGAQAYFGVRADLVAYGKVVGGGLPVSVVAGRAEFLDRVDGGVWADGPGPDPDSEKTYIGSTFEMHPLAMASARGILRHLRDQGPALQEALTARTTRLAETLNAFFEAEEVPIRVLHFSSVFRFAWRGNASYAYQPLEIEVFHFHLLTRGIYLWEGRTCFLSTAHTDEDLDAIVTAVKESVAALREGEFLPPAPASAADTPRTVPLGEEQRPLLALERAAADGAPSWTVPEDIRLRGPLDLPALRRAVAALTARHEALRTVFPDGGAHGTAEVRPAADIPVDIVDLTAAGADRWDEAVQEWWRGAMTEPFDLAEGPLLRVAVLRLADDSHELALLAHHIVTDGWSVSVLTEELAALYTAERRGTPAALARALQHRDLVRWQERRRPELTGQQAYWTGKFGDGFPDTLLPTARDRDGDPGTHRGARFTTTLDAELLTAVKNTGRAHKASLFMTLLTAYSLLVHELTGQDDIVIGTPQAGRTLKGSETAVGYCAHFLPVRSTLAPGTTLAGQLRAVRETVLAAFEHQEVPFARLRDALGAEPGAFPLPLRTVFNLDRATPCPDFDGLKAEFRPVPTRFALTDFRLDGLEDDGGLRLDFDYRTDLFDEAVVRSWADRFRALLQALAADPERRVDEV